MAVPRSALVVIDMISRYDHPDAERLTASVREALPQMVALVDRAGEEEALTVFVNDHPGPWTSNRDDLTAGAFASAHRELVEPILPAPDALFVVKARHSIFYETPLEYLLRQEGIERVVLIGQVTEQCILYSALDGYIRHFDVAVPADATAHIHRDLADAALRMMELNMRADVTTAADVALV
jgi:nicotinamidase-related amidase